MAKRVSGQEVQITAVDYHRNGISGEAFHLVRFFYGTEPMVATVFAERGRLAVVCLTDLDQCWRGDTFERVLREAIAKHNADLAQIFGGDFGRVEVLPPDSEDACPGCGKKPGEGLTDGCEAEDGCGYWRAMK